MTVHEHTERARVCEIESAENLFIKNDVFGASKWAQSCESHAAMAFKKAKDYADYRNAEHATGLAIKSWRLISKNNLNKKPNNSLIRIRVLKNKINLIKEGVKITQCFKTSL